jgi:hypothetical protein
MDLEYSMKKWIIPLLFWTLILGACSPNKLTPQPDLPVTADTATPLPNIASPTFEPTFDFPTAIQIPKIIATVRTPHIDQSPDGKFPGTASLTPIPPPPIGNCGYQWAYKDLPELSADFEKSIQDLQPEAQSSAFAFGEDCVYADGSATFLAMETDFNVTLKVTDPASEAELGEWIVKVMQVILNIPKDMIVGPRPGRVGIAFQAGINQKSVTFYLDQYQVLPSGLSSAEIYQALQTP